MHYKVSDDICELKSLLIELKTTYPDYAFVSYIDGEFGIRAWLYNSYVKMFVDEIKDQNIQIVGLCFIGHKCFLGHLCDHVIEVQSTCFNNITNAESIDNSHTSLNHAKLDFVPSNKYAGTDGWDLTYIRGIHNDEYENMLKEIDFANIFYTTHCDGARLINVYNQIYVGNNMRVILYKCNNNQIKEQVHLDYICSRYREHISNIISSNEVIINNNIAIWIRNTNKWPERNISPSVYLKLFDYCITNNKTLHVFQDLIPIKLPTSEYIIECNYRLNNIPDFDKFKEICDMCCMYIGVASGPLYIANSLCNIYTICLGRDKYNFFCENKNNITIEQTDLVNVVHSIFTR